MSSIVNRPNGTREIRFTLNGRKILRLGDVPKKTAQNIQSHVDALLAWHMGGHALPAATAEWVKDMPAELRERAERAGLIEPAAGQNVPTVAAFVDGYLAQRLDVKPTTQVVLQQARRALTRFMGEGKPLDRVTPADADAFRADLLARKLAKATVNKWCRYARHFFTVAQRRRLIADNPFGHIKGAVKGDPAKRMFVTAADVQKVIDVATDPQWKLLIALARFGGLRIPSEAQALRWRDVDFERTRFIVRSSKTEHHSDGGVRVVPMFPELAPLFQAVYDAAPEGTEYVISRYRDAGVNLRTQLVRYITAAGLKPWPKPWQNLRASRATELVDRYPSHVCAAWLGHTEAVADEFYRQVTDDHFAAATKAHQNAHQPPPASGRQTPPAKTKAASGGSWRPSAANDVEGMGDKGLEPLTSRV